MDMEDAVQRKAEDEVALASIKGRMATLTDEADRLRRQVHDLQQESADKEVKLMQLTKARAQDEEDKDGLNIALDSKQQELELVRVSCHPSIGSWLFICLAQTEIRREKHGRFDTCLHSGGLPDLGSRRQSLICTTPSAPRPRPGTAIGITKASNTEKPIRKSLSFSIGVRAASSTVNPSSRMGPPPTPRGTPLSASTTSLVQLPSSSKP